MIVIKDEKKGMQMEAFVFVFVFAFAFVATQQDVTFADVTQIAQI